MASRPRELSPTDRAEIVGTLRPLVDRFSGRFGVAPSAILKAVQQGMPMFRLDQPPALPANYVPKHSLMAKLLIAAHGATDLSPASIIEDNFDKARVARDAVIYAARSVYDLSYETIGRALGEMHHEAVMDGYCRALGIIEQANKEFHSLVQAIAKGGRR